MKVAEHHFEKTTDELLALLRAAEASDDEAERVKKRYGTGIAISILAMFISFFIVAGTEIPGLFVLTALCFIALIFCIVKLVSVRGLDLDDDKLQILTRFLQIASADIPRTAPVSMKVDFRDYQTGGELLSKEGGTFSNRQMKYRHPWSEFRFKLADGSAVRLVVGHRVSRKEKPKRKYTKVRESLNGEIQLTIRLGAKRYGGLEGIATRIEQNPPPSPLMLKQVTQQGQQVSAAFTLLPYTQTAARYGASKVGEENKLTADHLLQSLLCVYSAIGAQRRSA